MPDRSPTTTPTHYEASRRVVNSKNETTYFLTVEEACQIDGVAVSKCEGFHSCGVHYLPVHLPAADAAWIDRKLKPTQAMPVIHIDDLRELCAPESASSRTQPSKRSKVGHVMVGVLVGIVLFLSAYSVGRQSGRALLVEELCDRAAEVCK